MEMKSKQEDGLMLLLAAGIGVAQWLFLTLSGADKMFFTETPELPAGIIWATRLCSLGMLCAFWTFLAHAVLKIRAGDKRWTRGAKIFAVYFSIQMILLLILWPGTWAWDDVSTLLFTKAYRLNAWQHIFTSLFYICCAHILPFPGGIIFIQNVIIAFCLPTILVIAEEDLGLKRLTNPIADIVVKLFPFLLPPVVIYQFGGYRTGLLIYLEVLAVVLVAKFLKQRQCKRAGMIAFAIMIGVISEWRSENIIYMILGIIAIVALTKNTIPERMAAIVLCIMVFGSIHRVEKNYMGSSYYYLIRSSILPAVELMKAADPVRDQEEIRKMAPIIHPEILKENPNADGYYVWDQERIYEIDISKEMYDDYMDGMIQLAFKYPHVLWKERSDRFAGAIGLRGSTVQVSSVSYAVHLMDIGQNEWYEAWRATEHSGIRPVFPEVRKHFIYLLGQQKPDTIPEPLFYVFWNGIIPTAFILMAFFYAIVKRSWILFLISGFFLAKTVIIFAAESGSLFMYYLPQYVVGYMLLSAGIVMLLNKGGIMKSVVQCYKKRIQNEMPRKKMSNCYRIKYPLIIAVVQWFITTVLQVDRAFFTYDQETLYFVLTKILYLAFLCLVWCFVFEAYEKIKQNDKDWKRGASIFLPYFTTLMIMLLILWPGTWAYDDLLTLTDISSYGMWCPWQNILTGAYQDVLLQILPFPGGIIFLQNAIISLCVAFSVVKIEKVFEIPTISNPALDIVIKLLPFLLPPILMYQFSGYRMGIYVYLELVMLVILVGMNKTKSKWGWKKVLLFSVICSIVSTWRTESFVYVPATCILLLFVRKDVISKQKKIICFSLIIMGFLGITRFQNWALGDSSYEVISLMRPCVELVRRADTVRDAKELEAIDKVADIKIIMDNPGVNGETMYWNTACIRNHNDNPNDDYNLKDYQEFRKAFVALSLKYPNVVLKERWSLFIRASGITGDSLINAGFAARLFDADNDEQAVRAVLNKGWFANLPVFKGFRARFIEILGVTSEANIFVTVLKRVIWNSIIPELILICAWIGLCIRKSWYLAGVFATVLLKLPIIFLTEPSYWIMYVLSFYLLGYVVLMFSILKWKFREKSAKRLLSGLRSINEGG